MKTQKVLLVTGASKGFGYEIAKAALAAGDKVIATVRSKAEKLTAALDNNPGLLVVTMDVTQEEQVKAAVKQGIDHFGRIDVLINNAGFGIVTAIEEATDAEVKNQYETNVFGLLNVVRAVLPHLRAQRSGHIINVSSLFGFDAIRAGGYMVQPSLRSKASQKGWRLNFPRLVLKLPLLNRACSVLIS